MSGSVEVRREDLRICFMGAPDSIHTRRWLESVAKSVAEVHLLCLDPLQSPPPAGVHVHALRDRAASLPGRASPIRTGRAHAWVRLLIGIQRYRSAGLKAALSRIKPDVLHAHYVSDAGVVAALSGFRPLVLSAWGSDILVDPGRSLPARWLVQYALRSADAVTFDSDEVASEIRRLAGREVPTAKVLFGVERSRLSAPIKDKQRVILSARNHEPHYNIDAVVRAWATLEADMPAWSLEVAGSGSQTAHLQALVKHLRAHRVVFSGALSRDDLWAELQKASLFVSVPSWDGVSATLLEAMAAGCLPVVSDLPSNHEWVTDGDNGTVSGGDLTGDLRAAIALVEDEPRFAAIRDENRRLIESRAVFEDQMERALDLYQQVCRNPGL